MVGEWVVDAMNVIGTRPDGWWNDPDKAMSRMADTLDGYASATGERVTLVFDKQPRRLAPDLHIEVIVARWKGRNAADHEIEEIVAAHSDPGSLSVVTSDKKLAARVKELGGRVVSSGRFLQRVERVTGERTRS